MQPTFNPYAAPAAPPSSSSGGSLAGSGCWRDGKDLVLEDGGELPARCVKCNRRAETPIKARRLYWHSPLVYLTLLFNVLIYIVVALIVRKSVVVKPGLCQECREARNRRMLYSWLTVLGGIAGVAFGLKGDYGALALAGLLMVPAGLLAALFTTRLVWAAKIDPPITRLRGCSDAFLANFPSASADR